MLNKRRAAAISSQVMNALTLAFRQLPKSNGLTAAAVLTLALLFVGRAFADLAVHRVEIGSRAPASRVPDATAHGRFLAPQAISAVDVSADGKFITVGTMAFGHDANVWQVNPNQKLWTAPPTVVLPPTLPSPAADFPDMAKDFRLAADALVPGHVATAVALNGDGSRVAVVEYGVWSWVRSRPVIEKWDPPIHTLNFLPGKRGRLRVFDGNGKELFREMLPEDGMFEVGFGDGADEVWCWPTTWFARGMAGAAWLPVDRPAGTLYHVELGSHSAAALAFPDAIADCAVSSKDGRAMVSCWDGRICLLEKTDFEVSGLKVHALFVPGHSFDLTIYMTELNGKRIAFTGDLGFENQDILHRCWGDAAKAREVVRVVRNKLLSWRPAVVFTGHGVRTNGTEFLAQLVRQTEQSLGLPAPAETNSK